MVLRKSPPPLRIDVSGHNSPLNRAQSTSSASTTLNPSPKRAERRRHRANSASSEQEAVYSPNLHTSPAFDLQPLEEAQKSPWRSPLSALESPWQEEPAEKSDQTTTYPPASDHPNKDQKLGLSRVPPIVMAGTARRQAAELAEIIRTRTTITDEASEPVPPRQLKSNNPFLKSTNQTSYRPEESGSSHDQHIAGNQTRSPNYSYINHQSLRSSQDSSELVTIAADRSIIDRSDNAPLAHPDNVPAPNGSVPNEYLNWTGDRAYSPTPSAPTTTADRAYLYEQREPQNATQYQSAPGAEYLATPLQVHGNYTNTSRSQGSNFVPSASEDLIDLNDSPRMPHDPRFNKYSIEDNNSSTGASGKTPTQPTPVIHPLPPLSDAELKRQAEQQAETYSIRHINWTDCTGQLRESPMLIQNKNGPCPLLALVNALVMRSDRHMPPPIVKALMTRETISLGLLIQALFDELTTQVGVEEQLPDIEALSRFLTMLHTGMNVNPRLTLEHGSFPGTFLETSDLRLYESFGVRVLHGWVASPPSTAFKAMNRIAQYYEDIQLLQFRKEELEHQGFQGVALMPDEEQLIRDIDVISSFINVEYPTQLTWFGLDQLNKVLQPGSISILFRNDHFSTLYKHPQSHQLFTLITDAGYSTHAEIVWESLADVKGSSTDYFSGDFCPIHHESTASSNNGIAGQRASSLADTNNVNRAGTNIHPHNEQTDADYAYALSLQFQEEAERVESRSRATQNLPQPQPLPQSPSRRSSSPGQWVQPSTDTLGGVDPYPRISSNGANRQSNSGTRSSQSNGGTRSSQSNGGTSPSHQRDSSRHALSGLPPLPLRREQDSGPANLVPSFEPGDDHDITDDTPPPSYDQVARNKLLEARGLGPGLLTSPVSGNRGRTPALIDAGPSSGRQSRYQNPISTAPQIRRPSGGHTYSASMVDRPKPRDRDCVVM